MSLDVILMVTALLLMASAIGARILTLQILSRMRYQISSVEMEKKKAVNLLKQTKAQKNVTAKTKLALEGKKIKLTKKKKVLLKKLREYLGQSEHRQKLQEEKRAKLVRPPATIS